MCKDCGGAGCATCISIGTYSPQVLPVGPGGGAGTSVTMTSNGDGTVSTTNADGSPGPTLCEGPCGEIVADDCCLTITAADGTVTKIPKQVSSPGAFSVHHRQSVVAFDGESEDLDTYEVWEFVVPGECPVWVKFDATLQVLFDRRIGGQFLDAIHLVNGSAVGTFGMNVQWRFFKGSAYDPQVDMPPDPATPQYNEEETLGVHWGRKLNGGDVVTLLVRIKDSAIADFPIENGMEILVSQSSGSVILEGCCE